jgi:hypothetical protein
MPYTIVLTPPAEQAVKYVEVSQALYSNCQPTYLLVEEGTSAPHITVVQFDCESIDVAHDVWVDMCAKMREQNFAPFSPPFVGVSFIGGVGPYVGSTWVELSIKRGDENSPIMKVHYAALEVLKQFNLEPLNAIGNNYRPHLTLARIIMPEQLRAWPKVLYEHAGAFRLEFGLSDEKWQYAQTLETFP